MEQNILLEFFKVGTMKLTRSEIEQIMDEEIEKDPSEMDVDLVELCLDVLMEHSR